MLEGHAFLLELAFFLIEIHNIEVSSGEAGLRALVMLCMEEKADGGLGA